MLTIAIVLAAVGLVALVCSVATTQLFFAWICIATSIIGVGLLIVDAVNEYRQKDPTPSSDDTSEDQDHDDHTDDHGQPEEVVEQHEESGLVEYPFQPGPTENPLELEDLPLEDLPAEPESHIHSHEAH